MSWELRDVWGPEKWYEWTVMSWDEGLAVLLGLKGLVKGHKSTVVRFLSMLAEEEGKSTENGNWGCARTRNERTSFGRDDV